MPIYIFNTLSKIFTLLYATHTEKVQTVINLPCFQIRMEGVHIIAYNAGTLQVSQILHFIQIIQKSMLNFSLMFLKFCFQSLSFILLCFLSVN